MSGGRIALLVVGSILALVSLGLLAGGGTLLWAHAAERDDDGYYSTRSERFESRGFAIVSDDLDLGTEGPDWLFDEGRLGKIRIEEESTAKPLFLGIGPKDDVERYLEGVGHDVVEDVDLDPFDVDYRSEPGSREPAAPQSQTFWAATGVNRVVWDIDEGDWVAVAMNADGSRGVEADVSIAAKTNLVIWAALVVLGLGVLFGAAAALALVFAVRGIHREPAMAPPEAAVATPDAEYPVQLHGELEPALSRWLWLVKWLLLIPHVIVLAFLWAATIVTTIVAFFAILFTERYPRSLFAFNLGVLRWTWRVSWYGYAGLGTDRYPPFTLRDVDYPARLTIPYPERLSRGLVLVKWWLLAIPHYLVVAFFIGGGWWWWSDDEWGGTPGLIILLVFFAAVVLLVRNRYPRTLYELVLGMDRWVARVVAYALLMRDEYPPFRLDR